MNEENTVTTEEVSNPGTEPVTSSDETEAAASGDGSVTEVTESVVVETITIQELQAIGSDIVHTSLFGSFLICGTLIGLAILRKVHGT